MNSRVADAHSLILTPVDKSAPAANAGREAASKLTDTETRVSALFRSRLELDVDVDTDVIESGVLDSMAFVQLLLELEGEFETAVSMGSLDLEDFRSIRSIARYVESTRAGR